MLKLCGFGASNYHNKVKLVLIEKNIPFEEELKWVGEADLDASPLGKIPYLNTDQGSLCESAVMLEYIEQRYPQHPLLPSDPFAAAKVRGAELDLSYCEVRAPIAGYTGRLARSEGSLVSPGADGLLTTVVQREQVWARCGVSEQDFARLFQGDAAQATRAKVEVLDRAGQPLPFVGKVNFVSAQVEARLGTIQMRAEFPNAGNQLLPGQFVRLRLEGKPLEGAVTVPTSSLLQSAQGRFVYILGEGNVATMRPVQIEVIIGPLAVVSGGLKSGDRVILDNLVKIRPGALLAPRTPAAK